MLDRSQVTSVADIARELKAADTRGEPYDVILIDSLRRLAHLAGIEDGTNAMPWRRLLETRSSTWSARPRGGLLLLHHQNRMGKFADSGDIAAVADGLLSK